MGLKYREEGSKSRKHVELKGYARSGSVFSACACGGELVVLEAWGKDGCCVGCTKCGKVVRYEIVKQRAA